MYMMHMNKFPYILSANKAPHSWTDKATSRSLELSVSSTVLTYINI